MTVDPDGDGADAAAGTSNDPASADADQDQLRRDLDKLSTTVLALSTTVGRLSGASSADEAPLDDDPDRDGAAEGEDLVAWVQWLVARYELDNVPDCWTQHGALVEELDALRIGWLDTIGGGQDGLARMHWHYYLGHALDRFDRRWRARNCEDTHRDTILPAWVTKDPGTLDAPDLDAGRHRR